MKFVDYHNEDLEKFEKSDERLGKSSSELKKAKFNGARKETVATTVEIAGRLALGLSEIADFLYRYGSRVSINKAVDTLVDAGLLIRIRAGDLLDDDAQVAIPRPERWIILTDGRLESAYETYLLQAGNGEAAAGLPQESS